MSKDKNDAVGEPSRSSTSRSPVPLPRGALEPQLIATPTRVFRLYSLKDKDETTANLLAGESNDGGGGGGNNTAPMSTPEQVVVIEIDKLKQQQQQQQTPANFFDDFNDQQTSTPDGHTEDEHSTPSSATSDSDEVMQTRTLTITRNRYNLKEFDQDFGNVSRLAKVSTDKKVEEPACSHLFGCLWCRDMPHDRRLGRAYCVHHLQKWFPIVVWLRKYNFRKDFGIDLIAGLTLAIFHVPQCMGYALLSGVAPIYGLYSGLIAPILYAIMGTARHASIGTFAIISLMTGGILADLAEMPEFAGIPPIALATLIAFLVGVYQFIFSITRLGCLSRYMSPMVTEGFTVACAIYVISSQLGYLTGVHLKPSGSGQFALFGIYQDFVNQIHEGHYNVPTIALSGGCIVGLFLWKLAIVPMLVRAPGRVLPYLQYFPIELVLVVALTFCSWLFHFEAMGISIIGPVPIGLPSLVPLHYQLLVTPTLLKSCLVLAIVGFAITYSTGKVLGARHNYKVVANQELAALGVTNIISSHFQCLPTAASLSRSCLLESVNARSQLTAFVNSIFILVVLLFLSPLLQFLPKAVLASIICVAMKKLLMEASNFFLCLFVSKMDSVFWLVTFVAVLVLNVDAGLLIGVGFNICFLVRRLNRPKTFLLGSITDTNVFAPFDLYPAAAEIKGIKIFQFCGPLNFSNMGYFESQLGNKIGFKKGKRPKKMESPIQVLIIECSMITNIDMSGMNTLRSVVLFYRRFGIQVYLSTLAAHVAIKVSNNTQFLAAVDKECLFISLHDAVDKAHEIVDMLDVQQQQQPRPINLKDSRRIFQQSKANSVEDTEHGHMALLPTANV